MKLIVKNVTNIIEGLGMNENPESITILEDVGTNSKVDAIREMTSRALVKKNVHDSLKIVITNKGKGINDMSTVVAMSTINELLSLNDKSEAIKILEDTVNILISKMNLDEIKKEKILSLDWNNNDLKKFKEISKKSKENSDMVIFIKGKQNYIDNINENIEKWVSTNKHIKIIDCYEFFEIEDKIDKIANEYSKVLGTSRL